MSLLDEINTKVSPELIAAREHGAIAAQLSEGRTEVVQVLGGIGLIIEALGPEDGAQVLDALQANTATNSALKWGWYLIERGDLDFGSTTTRHMLDKLANDGVLTQAQADALKAVAVRPATVSVQAVIDAMEG